MKKSKIDKAYSKIASWLEARGFKTIKSKLIGYETPTSFSSKKTDKSLIPDFSATDRKAKHYFELALKKEKRKAIRNLVSKWKLLSMLANRKGGNLYLFMPRGNKSFTEKIVKEYNIEATLISLSTLKIPTSA